MNYLMTSEIPVASASLGQVYKKTKNNTYVAVKVQRPNLYFLIRRDVVILRSLGNFFVTILTTKYWCWNWRNN